MYGSEKVKGYFAGVHAILILYIMSTALFFLKLFGNIYIYPSHNKYTI